MDREIPGIHKRDRIGEDPAETCTKMLLMENDQKKDNALLWEKE